MRIVVIGGSGFIGRPLLEQLTAGGHEVIAVQRRLAAGLPERVRQIACDQLALASKAESLRRFRPDVVIDIVSSSAPQALSTTSVFAGHAGHLIGISSQDVYKAFAIFHGTAPGPIEPVPLTERSPRRTSRALYPPEILAMLSQRYGWVTEDYDNVEMEDVVLHVRDLPATVLRMPMIYGPGDHLHRLHPVLKRIDDGRSVIPVADTVAPWRAPRGFIRDVVSAIVLAAERPRAAGRPFNVAEEESLSELEWIRLVGRLAGWSGEVKTVPFAASPKHLQLPGNFAQHGGASSRAIRETLGYRETMSREEALRETIAWERANPPEVFPPLDYEAEDRVLSGVP